MLIAGGSGAIGQSIEKEFKKAGYHVYILTRKPNKNPHAIFWSPKEKILEWDQEHPIDVLINLCGAGIAEKRWSKSRKTALESSRIEVTEFLYSWMKQHHIPIGRYIGASGVTAFPFNTYKKYDEEDTIEGGYIQNLVKKWESAHDDFKGICPVSIVRIAPTIKKESGLIVKMEGVIKKGFGSYLGKGTQLTQWVHHEDLARIFLHINQNNLNGIYHGSAGNCTNIDLTDALAEQLGKKIWLPKTPGFLIKLMFGEMSDIMLGSLEVASDKIKSSGFEFKYPKLPMAVKEIYTEADT